MKKAVILSLAAWTQPPTRLDGKVWAVEPDAVYFTGSDNVAGKYTPK